MTCHIDSRHLRGTALEAVLFLLIVVLALSCEETPGRTSVQSPHYKVGFLGAPSDTRVEWNDANMQRMKELGFNTMQLNIAWGSRPNDEPLNLEDVVAAPEQVEVAMDRNLATTLRTPEKIETRSAKLRQRLALCKKHGFRTIFHFGAPQSGHPRVEKEPLPQCTSDSATANRYVALIQAFNSKFPGVDDLLVYTYDQDAWLCSEYGPCPRCHGVPLAERVAPFVNTLARTWKEINPQGTLWWEPWELSAGQVYKSVELLDSTCVSLALHSNITEVQIAHPADRWFKNMLGLAERRKLPVIAEVWTGSPTEEMETFTCIPTPLLTLQALRAVSSAGRIAGIKEYYGNVPDKEDPNLRVTGLFFSDPGVSDDAALTELAKPYGKASEVVQQYWRLTSDAVAYYPWDLTWFAREVGRSNPSHSMSAATLRGASWETPSWQSSRKAAFIRTDESHEPNFWMREDAQIRFELAALKMEEAINVASTIRNSVPQQYQAAFDRGIEELSGFKRRCLAFVYHLRETNLANLIRSSIRDGLPVERRNQNIAELRDLLVRDQANQGNAEPLGTALKLLDKDVNAFLRTYFLPVKTTIKDEWNSNWSVTSE